MTRTTTTALFAGLATGLWTVVGGGAAYAQTPASAPQVAIGPAQRGAVFLSKDDFSRAMAARSSSPAGAGLGLAALGAVRAGDDRINMDVIRRVDAKAEGPVSHNVVTEIYIITDGGGVMETGGQITDGKPMVNANGAPVNPANIGPSMRGEHIAGGAAHHVGVGDVVMIPPNVPHRFLSLDGSVTYMVVRVNPGYEKGR